MHQIQIHAPSSAPRHQLRVIKQPRQLKAVKKVSLIKFSNFIIYLTLIFIEVSSKVLGIYTACGILGAFVLIGLSNLASSQPSPQFIFVMFGFFHLLLMLVLLRFRFPQKFIDYLQPFSIVSLDFSFFYHIPGIEWLSQRFNIKSLGNLELGRIDMKDDSFLANYLSTIIFLILLLSLHTIAYSIYFCSKSSIEKNKTG